jgi:hypothetical protein
MRRKAHNRLWTLIFTLSLCALSTVGMPGKVRAGFIPTDPSAPGSPPTPGVGDPDVPVGSPTPKSGQPRGVSQPVNRNAVVGARPSWLSVWMYKVRMAFAAGFRAFFPF